MGTPSFDLKFDLEDNLKNVFYVNFSYQRALLDLIKCFDSESDAEYVYRAEYVNTSSRQYAKPTRTFCTVL